MSVKTETTQAHEVLIDPVGGKVMIDGKNIPGVSRVMVQADPRLSRVWIELAPRAVPVVIKGSNEKPITFDTFPPISPKSTFIGRFLCRMFGHRFEPHSEWPMRWQCKRCGRFSVD